MGKYTALLSEHSREPPLSVVRSIPHITCMQSRHGMQRQLIQHFQWHDMCFQEYASLLRVQALEQRLAIIKAELKEDSASEEGPSGGLDTMQEA